VRRAIELSATRYCPVSAMLRKGGVNITDRYRVIDEATGQEETGTLELSDASASSSTSGQTS
jgi:hypothetical protein